MLSYDDEWEYLNKHVIIPIFGNKLKINLVFYRYIGQNVIL